MATAQYILRQGAYVVEWIILLTLEQKVKHHRRESSSPDTHIHFVYQSSRGPDNSSIHDK